MVDPKGIEPSNLTDANRALSQLSYEPKSIFNLLSIIPQEFHFVKSVSLKNVLFFIIYIHYNIKNLRCTFRAPQIFVSFIEPLRYSW